MIVDFLLGYPQYNKTDTHRVCNVPHVHPNYFIILIVYCTYLLVGAQCQGPTSKTLKLMLSQISWKT